MAIVNNVIKNYQLTVGCFMLSYLGWDWILLILLKTENWKLKTIKKLLFTKGLFISDEQCNRCWLKKKKKGLKRVLTQNMDATIGTQKVP